MTQKITTIVSIAALTVSALTLSTINAKASNAYELALLGSGFDSVTARNFSRPRGSGLPLTMALLEKRKAKQAAGQYDNRWPELRANAPVVLVQEDDAEAQSFLIPEEAQNPTHVALYGLGLNPNVANIAAYNDFRRVGDANITADKINAIVAFPVDRQLAAALARKHSLDITDNGILSSVKRLTNAITDPAHLPLLTADYVNAVRYNGAFIIGTSQNDVATHINALAQAGRFNLGDADIKASFAHADGLADWLANNE